MKVLKGLNLDGPVILPVPEDLPAIVKPRPADLMARAAAVAGRYGFALEEESLLH